MKKRILKQINKLMPTKMLRRQQFISRIKNRRRHQRIYNSYSYKGSPKASRFNRWQDYKRFVNRSF